MLVHEAIDLQVVARQGGLSDAQVAHLRESHTDVTKLGALAQEAGVPTLMLAHLAPGSIQLPDASWQLKAQRGFTGTVVVGTDGKVLPVGVPVG